MCLGVVQLVYEYVLRLHIKMCLGVVHSGPEKRIGLTKMSPKTVPHILKIEHDTKSKTVFNYIKFWKSFDVNTVQTICQ